MLFHATLCDMPKRRLEAILMIRGARERLAAIRADLDQDHMPLITSRIWRAEQSLLSAENALAKGAGRIPSDRGSELPPAD